MLEITLEEFQRRRKQKSTHVLDVLPASRFRQGQIPGAVNLPLSEVSRDAWRVIRDKSDEVIVYCGGFT